MTIPWWNDDDVWCQGDYRMRAVKCVVPGFGGACCGRPSSDLSATGDNYVWEWVLWVVHPDDTSENIAFHRLNSFRRNPQPPRRWADRVIRAWERAR